MGIHIKICGLTTAEAVAGAVEAGADALGFVFADSPRRMAPAAAAALTVSVPPRVARVAVMRHPTVDEWREVAEVFRPDWLQTDAVDLDDLEIPPDMLCIPVYRDVPGFDPAAIPGGGPVVFEAETSGTGSRPDWMTAAALARRRRVMLAGGLNPDNVAEAIRRVRPWGVDVSSGVEVRRGCKDLDRIAAFVAAARNAERMYAR